MKSYVFYFDDVIFYYGIFVFDIIIYNKMWCECRFRYIKYINGVWRYGLEGVSYKVRNYCVK